MDLERLFSQSHRTKYVNRFCDDEKKSSVHELGSYSERNLLGSYQYKEIDRGTQGISYKFVVPWNFNIKIIIILRQDMVT